jgi:hypothetical protein
MAAHRAVAVDRDFDAVRVALVAHEAQGSRVSLGAGAVGVDGLTAPATRQAHRDVEGLEGRELAEFKAKLARLFALEVTP